MQDACHMNFVIDVAHHRVSVAQWLEYQSAESEGLRFDSSWGLRIFSMFLACNKMKTSSQYQASWCHETGQTYQLEGVFLI